VSIKFIANEPWLMTECGLQLVVAVASRDEFFAEVRERALAALDGKPLENTRSVTTRADVAVIPVHGPLFRHANLLTEMSGATSYETLRKDLEVALKDPKVNSILLDIDSPGGEAKGVSELSASIVDARKRKPVKAYVGGMGASAAYWIASAADEVIAADTAQLGSIGVIAAYRDEDDGKTIEFVSSQSPYKNASPSTDAGKAKIQARIDALAEVFIDSVARNRGVSSAKVLEKFGKGDVMVGKHAVAAGLADRIGTFESTLASMSSSLVKFGRETVMRASTPTTGIPLMEFARMEVGR
jgi:signal peptide peptidase SppA